MTKQEITHELINALQAFWNEAKDLTPEAFHQSINDKWSAAQNFEHINKGLKPTAKYFSLPKTEIETRFGLSNYPSGKAAEVMALYTQQLSKGSTAPERMIPGNTEESYEVLTTLGHTLLDTLLKELQNWNEEELDKYNCPHIVLGNITPREMLYFLISHVEHHRKTIARIKESFHM